MPTKDIGKTLKELRINANLSQKQAYEYIGVAQSTFSSWETGKAEPPTEILLRLCKLYKVNDILTAFGYDGYKEDGSLLLNLNESNMIEKYRALDTHGKKMVDFTLENEYQRSIKQNNIADFEVPGKEYLKPVAAHQRTDIDVPEGTDMSDDDIMKDF